MTGFLSLIPGEWWGYIISAFAAIAALAATWIGGRKSARTDAKIKDAKAAAKSNKDMNNVDTMGNADDAARIERMRRFERDNGS